MIIGKVIGSAVSTLKDQRLQAKTLLLVCPADHKGEVRGDPILAVDLVGAGEGEVVFLVQGSTARVAVGSQDMPADAAIVGIIDVLSVEGQTTYFKS